MNALRTGSKEALPGDWNVVDSRVCCCFLADPWVCCYFLVRDSNKLSQKEVHWNLQETHKKLLSEPRAESYTTVMLALDVPAKSHQPTELK